MEEQETTTPTFEERLSDLIQQGVERAKELERQITVSVTEEIDPPDPLYLFANSSGFASERWYWEQPSEDTALVALGVASGTMPPRRTRFKRCETLHENLVDQAIFDPPIGDENPGPMFFSAFAFDPERKPDWRVWRGFAAAYFLLPKASLVWRDGRCFATYNSLVRAKSDPQAVLAGTKDIHTRVQQAITKGAPEAKYDSTYTPEDEGEPERMADEYREAVRRATGAVQAGQFEKVVIAQPKDVTATMAFDVARALVQLREDYPDCYLYAIGRHSSAFFGASPEQLVKLDGKEVSTVCVAGSIGRGETRDEDKGLADQLLASEKDRHEHEVCVRAIRESLEPLCSELTVPETPELMTVSNVHHLRTPVRGTLANGATLLQLVDRLHPTPAVGGYPKDEALQFLRENESFDRGWYASPLGWFDVNGNGEFLVTLRSAIIGPTRGRMFAGCGIVAESDPEQELAEMQVKLRPILSALNQPAQVAETVPDTDGDEA